ncbi:CoA-binding protein [Roseobacter sp. N2S]|uniref:acetate--CoA ligase family protein n=1 Tax=Roseobacter sp. N2S TaxID=2663844 RepID=UPI002861319D|nr:CoA-binding protein [Roseobacter sp. N2S]MDR6265841.1 acyl-CoA synthetase (NDP forming) [Roseobacter sp. N2S]
MTVSRNLDRLFTPQAVAVLGASANPEAIGGQPVAHLQNQGFSGAIYPINPKYSEVAGLPCYGSLADTPTVPDVVIVAIPAQHVEAGIKAAGEKGIPFAIVFSAGYAEAGEAGAKRQAALCDIARAAGVTLIGPNCQGLMNISVPIHMGFGAPYGLSYAKGGFALTSQSGAFGNSLVMDLNDRGIGFARYISTGNESDLSSIDCLNAFLGMDEVTAIGAYVEGFKDLNRFADLARRAQSLGKPIMLWKVGNSPAGALAAQAHTANLSKSSDFAPDSFRALGVIDVQDARDMAICLKALQGRRSPAGPKVGVVTVSGGAGIFIADRCFERGLEVGKLSEDTVAQMRPHLPEFASLQNPVDVTGSAVNAPASLAESLSAVSQDSAVDSLILALAAVTGTGARLAAEEIARIQDISPKPVVVCWNGPRSMAQDAYDIFDAAGVPVFKSPSDAVRAIEAMCIFAKIPLSPNPYPA